MGSSRFRRALLITVSGLAVSTVALAQQSADGPYVLHEFFVAKSGPTAGGASPDTAPLQYGPGQPPPLSLENQSGEPIYDKDGPVLNEPPPAPYGPLTPFGGSNTLDDRTDRVDSLTYYANFDPSVIPYKRVVVQNHVVRRPGGEYAIEVEPGERTAVPVGTATPDDDLFWGSFLLRLEADRWQPIASVAPGQRLLDLQVEPDIALEVYRDEADNYFLRSRRSELVRVNMHLAAPRFYFSGEFAEVAWPDFPRDLVPPMDADLVNTGLRVARQLGFDRQSSPRETLMAMIAYFRNFDARPFPEELDRGDLFEAIATSQIGVCRHRSLAFVIMAQAMGIPTRYVYNEAHAFVEVYWPGGGWRRVDLGGAADELNASATENRSLHNAGNDALPTPERFLEEQQRMERNGWNPGNGSDQSGGGDDGPGDGARGDGDGEGEAEAAIDTVGEATPTADGEAEQGEGVAPPSAPATEPHNDVAAELITPEVAEQPPADQRAETRLAITDATAVVRRGGDMLLQGQLTDADGNPLAGREVEIYLGPVGSTEAHTSQRLGSTITDRFGRLGARVIIPREHSIGRWSLFLVFGGDETHRPAIAE